MADTTPTQSVMQVVLPEAGEVAEYQVSPDVPVKLNFFVSEVLFSCNGNDLVLTGENGASIVIKDYLTMAHDGTLPSFELNGGEQVPGDIYLFAFNDGALEVETAAGGDDQGVETMEGLGDMEDISHGNVLDLMVPRSADDFSSALDLSEANHHSQLSTGSLSYDEIFAGNEADYTLSGSSILHFDHDMTMVSLVDSYDPIGETIQHIIDSPDYV